MNWDRLADIVAGNRFLLGAGQWIFAFRHRLATLAMALLIVFLGYHVVFGANGMVAYQHKRAEQKKLQQDILRLQQENDRISGRVHQLKSDPGTIEREAREQLKYARPGEIVYVVPEARTTASAAGTAQKH